MKIRWSLLLYLLASLALMAQNVTVVSPNGGELLTLGNPYDIRWDDSGIPDNGKWLITLWQGGENKGIIADNLAANTKKFTWTVGKLQNTTDASPGSGYIIKVRLRGNPTRDYSDHGFTIKRNFQLAPIASKIKLNTPSPAINALKWIKVLKPATGDNWQEKGTYTIRWKTNVNKTSRIELYNYNGTKKVIDIASNMMPIPNPPEVRTYRWTIPKGFWKWPGNYRIRVSTADGALHGTGSMFHIKRDIHMVKKTHTLEPQVTNRAHRKYEYRCSSVDTQGTAFPQGPGEGIMRVGWENNWKTWGVGGYCHRHLSFAFRSFIHFDVTPFAKNVIIEKATLFLTKKSTYYSDSAGNVNNNHPGHCSAGLYQVLAPWSDPFDVAAEHIGEGPDFSFDITAIVRDWALKGDNHGMMLIGRDEKYKKNNEHCISYYSARLVVRTLEDQD